MSSELVQLLPFLADPKREVRKIAIQHIKGYTGTGGGQLILKDTNLISLLVPLLTDIDAISFDALTCLINLSGNEELRSAILAKNVVPILVDQITRNDDDDDNDYDEQNDSNEEMRQKKTKTKTKTKPLLELQALLLSNLTLKELGCHQLLRTDNSALLGFHACKLIDLFLQLPQQQQQQGSPEIDRYGWVANILQNITQIPEGRELLLNKERGPIISLLLPYIHHPSLIRRRSIIGTIRNCLFNQEHHDLLLSDDVGLASHLLYPLLSSRVLAPQELKDVFPQWIIDDSEAEIEALMQKEIESDLFCRKLVLECLFLLAAHTPSRDLLFRKNAYEIVAALHKIEKDPGILAEVDRLLALLVLEEDDSFPKSVREFS